MWESLRLWEVPARLVAEVRQVGKGVASFFYSFIEVIEGEHYLAWAVLLTVIALLFFAGSSFPSHTLHSPFPILSGGLSLAACIVVLFRDWRALLGALMAQYILAWLMLGGTIRPEVAFIKVIVGGLTCLILYLTARRLLPGSPFRGRGIAFIRFRLMMVFFGGLVAYGLFQRYSLAGVSLHVLFSAYWLMVMGVFTLIITEEALWAGVGLLTFELGFELMYTSLDPGLVLAGLFGAVNLLLALAIAYLSTTQIHHTPALPPSGRGEGRGHD